MSNQYTGHCHLTPSGDVFPCNASIRECKYEHFDSEFLARKTYEDRNATFKTIRVARAKKPIISPFNNEGLTDNMVEFRKELVEYGKLMSAYKRYRKRGLKEDRFVPATPYEISHMIEDQNGLFKAWKREDYETVGKVITDAMKRHYVNNKFDMEDIDCIFSDDEMVEIITSQN